MKSTVNGSDNTNPQKSVATRLRTHSIITIIKAPKNEQVIRPNNIAKNICIYFFFLSFFLALSHAE
jgi:hypothetical protein